MAAIVRIATVVVANENTLEAIVECFCFLSTQPLIADVVYV